IDRITSEAAGAAPSLTIEVGRVILDPKHVVAFQLFAPDECVSAFVEPEAQEVGRRDELRVARLPNERAEIRGSIGALRRRSRRSTAPVHTPVTLLRAAEEIGLVLPPLSLADVHAVDL